MKTTASILALLALTGCAEGQPKAYSAADTGVMSDVAAAEAGSCFRMSQIRNHKKFDNSTLLVEVGRGSVYRWEMSGTCLAGATSSDPLIMSPAAGGDLICKPIDLDLKVRAGGIASPCIIKKFQKLTPAEVAALPPKARP